MRAEVIGRWVTEWVGRWGGAVAQAERERLEQAAEEAMDLLRADFLRQHGEEIWEEAGRFERFLKFDAPFQGVVLQRLSRNLFLRDARDGLLEGLSYSLRAGLGMELYYSTEVGGGWRIMHGSGLVIGPRHRIGRDFTVYQGVTLGQRRLPEEEWIEIGDGVAIFAGAKVLGRVRIGDGARVAANAVVLEDVAAGATVAGAPAVRVK